MMLLTAVFLCSTARTWVYPAMPVATHDGDTVTFDLELRKGLVETQHVRFRGINAPELGAKDPEVRKRAVAARDYLASRIEGRHDVVVRVDRTDDFGRWLGEVWVGGECINETMIKLGYAVEYMP